MSAQKKFPFMNTDIVLEKLARIRASAVPSRTSGLEQEIVLKFVERDPLLKQAIEDAASIYTDLKSEFSRELELSEDDLILRLQTGFLNFYGQGSICPFVPLAANGPWLVTIHGAIIYDTGGYGMLGFGHSPSLAPEVFSKPLVMANIMTPSVSQYRFANALQEHIGFRALNGSCPYSKILCMNSGSEAVTVALRLTDVHAKAMTDVSCKHAAKKIKLLSLKGSFHGRTDRAASISNSCVENYRRHLGSFRDRESELVVEPNNVSELENVFEVTSRENIFVEAMFMEPVMGEGRPGLAITREFYDAARRLTLKHDSLLVVDSVQAGFRAQGCLSIVDYPSFDGIVPPDMEVFSKALNAGQFPLSVVALTPKAAGLYREGIYGNTMTANPRALEIGRAVLSQVTDALALNIRERGEEFLSGLKRLQSEMREIITEVRGTGLLLAAELDKKNYPVKDANGVCRALRAAGINVIPGGENALRFTPYFNINSDEINMILGVMRNVLLGFAKCANCQK